MIDHQSRKRKIVTVFNNGEWTQKQGAYALYKGYTALSFCFIHFFILEKHAYNISLMIRVSIQLDIS